MIIDGSIDLAMSAAKLYRFPLGIIVTPDIQAACDLVTQSRATAAVFHLVEVGSAAQFSFESAMPSSTPLPVPRAHILSPYAGTPPQLLSGTTYTPIEMIRALDRVGSTPPQFALSAMEKVLSFTATPPTTASSSSTTTGTTTGKIALEGSSSSSSGPKQPRPPQQTTIAAESSPTQPTSKNFVLFHIDLPQLGLKEELRILETQSLAQLWDHAKAKAKEHLILSIDVQGRRFTEREQLSKVEGSVYASIPSGAKVLVHLEACSMPSLPLTNSGAAPTTTSTRSVVVSPPQIGAVQSPNVNPPRLSKSVGAFLVRYALPNGKTEEYHAASEMEPLQTLVDLITTRLGHSTFTLICSGPPTVRVDPSSYAQSFAQLGIPTRSTLRVVLPATDIPPPPPPSQTATAFRQQAQDNGAPAPASAGTDLNAMLGGLFARFAGSGGDQQQRGQAPQQAQQQAGRSPQRFMTMSGMRQSEEANDPPQRPQHYYGGNSTEFQSDNHEPKK